MNGNGNQLGPNVYMLAEEKYKNVAGKKEKNYIKTGINCLKIVSFWVINNINKMHNICTTGSKIKNLYLVYSPCKLIS